MKIKPLVTVILPVYNAMPFIKESIESIINQTYKHFELIIIENGSIDGSKELCTKYAKKDKRIRIIYFDKPLGFAGEKASNIAIKQAKGKYIARMDADDISNISRLEKEVDFLEKNKNIFLVGSWANIINEKREKIGRRILPIKNRDIYKNFYLRNCIMNPTVMFRNIQDGKDFFTLEKDFPGMNDYYTYFLLLNKNKEFYNIPETLLNYRIHTKNVTFTNLRLKFKQNILIKKRMLNYGYRPNVWHRVVVYLQYLLTILIPEKWLFKIYLLLPNK